MKLCVIVDNYCAREDLKEDWGFSVLLDEQLLFDSGWHAEIFAHNLKTLNVDFSKLKDIVISHEHYDHAGGLEYLAAKKLTANLHFSKYHIEQDLADFRILSETDDHTKIWLTREFSFVYKDNQMTEHALVIKTEKGYSLLCGCSHAGIVEMIAAAKEYFSIDSFYLVAGGFHLKDKNEVEIREIIKEFRHMNIKNVAPTHCSGSLAMKLFCREYQKNYLAMGAGQIFEI